MTSPRICTAVVTGAARGIGLAAAERLLAAGHRVALVDRDGEALTKVATTAPAAQVLRVAVDVTSHDGPARIAAAVGGWPAVTILVNNAGKSLKRDGKSPKLAEMTLAEWDGLFALNVTAAMRLAQQFVPAMARNGWGRVINVSSRAGRGAGPNSSPAYMASKAAILGLTRSIASEFAGSGVTANSVAPGMVATDMAAEVEPATRALQMAGIPVGRIGDPAEIGALIAFLASEEAGYITGACIDANGGAFMC